MSEERGVYRFLVGKPEGRKPLGRPRRGWVDNISMDLQEVGCGYMDWIGLAQDRDRWRKLVRAVMNLPVPWSTGNFLTSCKPVRFSRRTLLQGVRKQGSVLQVWHFSPSGLFRHTAFQKQHRLCFSKHAKQWMAHSWHKGLPCTAPPQKLDRLNTSIYTHTHTYPETILVNWRNFL